MLPIKKLIPIALASLLGGGFVVVDQQRLFALDRNQLPSSAAQGRTGETVTLKVSPYGLVVSFEDLKESIEKYWATDDKHLRVGTNAPLGSEANLLFLKTEGKWSDKNGTAVTIKTRDAVGQSRTYSFLIEFTEDRPKYSILRIYPDSGSSRLAESQPTQSASISVAPPLSSPRTTPATVTPVQPTPSVTPSPINVGGGEINLLKNAASQASGPLPLSSAINGLSDLMKSQPKMSDQVAPPAPEKNEQASVSTGSEQLPIQAPSSPATDSAGALTRPRPNPRLAAILQSHSQANAIVRGLSIATKTKEVNRQGNLAKRLQYLIRRLRRGEDLVEAAKKEAVDMKAVNRLLSLGNYREPR